MEQLEQLVKPGMRVIDVGCGSGILSLLAVKLGAAHVYAIDNSSVAVESTIANAQLNGESEHITTVLGELDNAAAERMAGQYDVVVSNILAHVIGSIAPQLAKVMAPDGTLIVSGIIEPRLHDALEPLLAAGLEQVSQVMIDDWMALLLRMRV
jgi:ribosomal protein L11 methyltransferase